jgi:hypothetical protein
MFYVFEEINYYISKETNIYVYILWSFTMYNAISFI